MVSETVARPYAHALFVAALEQGDPSSVAQEFHYVVQLLQNSEDLARFLAHPQVLTSVKQEVIRQVVGHEVRPLLMNFLEVVIEKGREAMLPAMERQFRSLWDDERGVVRALVHTAQPLTVEERDQLVEALAKVTGKTVEIEGTVDASVVGGVVVHLGDWVFDNSLSRMLKVLSQRMRYGGSEGGYTLGH